MKKLTAGIFAGILTIVTVNAADAAIATSGYVTEKVSAVDKKVGTLDSLKTTAHDNTVAAINEVFDSVEGLTTGDNSVAQQIANKLGEGFPADSTVKAELDKKLNKSDAEVTGSHNYITAGTGVAANLGALDTQVKANETAITTLNGEGEGSVKKQINDAIDAVNAATDGLGERVTANKNAIDVLNGEGEGSVKKALADAKSYADTAKAGAITTANQNTSDLLGDGVTAENTVTKQFTATNANVTANATAIENITKENGTIDTKISAAQSALNTEIDKKQNLLNNTNVKVDGEGNVISTVTAVDGVVTATKGVNAVTVPVSAESSEAGTYVLTATVDTNGKPTYYWESIERATAQPTVE